MTPAVSCQILCKDKWEEFQFLKNVSEAWHCIRIEAEYRERGKAEVKLTRETQLKMINMQTKHKQCVSDLLQLYF